MGIDLGVMGGVVHIIKIHYMTLRELIKLRKKEILKISFCVNRTVFSQLRNFLISFKDYSVSKLLKLSPKFLLCFIFKNFLVTEFLLGSSG